jgi:hypothetical protein
VILGAREMMRLGRVPLSDTLEEQPPRHMHNIRKTVKEWKVASESWFILLSDTSW